MKRMVLTITVALAVLTIGVLWLTRERPEETPTPEKLRATTQLGGTQSGGLTLPPMSSRARTSRGAAGLAGGIAPVSAQAPRASVTVGQKTVQLTPNQVGNFQRTYIQPKATVPVQVAFPLGEPGQTVVLEAKDGGTFDGEDLAKVVKLDDQRRLAFAFHADSQPGIYRVSMRRGSEEKVLNFWVGNPPPVVER